MTIMEKVLERRTATSGIDPAARRAARIWRSTGVVPVAHMVTDGSDFTAEYELAALQPTTYLHTR
ncbi:MAG: hypothetical protein U0132_18855 [Gemmatimonadaceae bacterium]